jgi:hypothetical protein
MGWGGRPRRTFGPVQNFAVFLLNLLCGGGELKRRTRRRGGRPERKKRNRQGVVVSRVILIPSLVLVGLNGSLAPTVAGSELYSICAPMERYRLVSLLSTPSIAPTSQLSGGMPSF